MSKFLPHNSLRPLPLDKRDFSVGAVLGQINIGEVPNKNFVVAQPILIKDQGESDLCSAYAVTAVSEDQEGEELLPEFQFYKTKSLSGDPDEWGANLRDACKSAVKFGSLPLNGFKPIKGRTRAEVLDGSRWPGHADTVALMHKKETFFNVDGRYDVFDNIRTALWKNRDKKCSIVTGALWRNDWIDAPDGIIPSKYGSSGFGHAFKIFGQKIIKGEPYLVAQLSQGTGVGDNGLFYFNREVTNREIGPYGIFMFYDMPRYEAEKLSKKKAGGGLFNRIWSFLTSIL